MQDELWTVEDLAEHWKIRTQTVRAMLRRGELSGIKIRMNWRIYLSEILRYEREQSPLEKKRRKPEIGPMPKPVITRIS